MIVRHDVQHFVQRLADTANGNASLAEVLAQLNSVLDRDGLDSLAPGMFHGGLVGVSF